MSCERVNTGDWCIPLGGGWVRIYTAYTDKTKTTLYDISGWTVEGAIAQRGEPDEEIIELTTANGRIVISEEDSTITVQLDEETLDEVADIEADIEYQLIVRDSLGNLFTRIEGLVEVIALRINAVA